jgi:hypothetical protein
LADPGAGSIRSNIVQRRESETVAPLSGQVVDIPGVRVLDNRR